MWKMVLRLHGVTKTAMFFTSITPSISSKTMFTMLQKTLLYGAIVVQLLQSKLTNLFTRKSNS